MGHVVIRVENLGKLYHIGPREQFRTLRDSLTTAMTGPFRRLATATRRSLEAGTVREDTIWALKGVSFEVQRSEVVGIIGRNGAGKSTLLKILSRITEPTEGYAEIHGRVGSLLEVGTGFHPELTGRENICLNGAILGMKKSEISRKFDEIVAFAEIDKFIDTPVKHYSNGMYVRLAFAVAAHLQPEVLLVDEVLAVGDVAFQKKCLGKMDEVAKEGRTVLFVSHNMGAIIQLCSKSILLRSGQVDSVDSSEAVVKKYLSDTVLRTPQALIDPESNPHAPVILTRCWIADRGGTPITSVDVTKPFSIGLKILVRHSVMDADIGVRVYNALGQPIFTSNLSDSPDDPPHLSRGEHTFLVQIPSLFLAPDMYSLTLGIHRPNVELLDYHEQLLTFHVEESGSKMWQYHGKGYGNILVQFPWQHKDSE